MADLAQLDPTREVRLRKWISSPEPIYNRAADSCARPSLCGPWPSYPDPF